MSMKKVALAVIASLLITSCGSFNESSPSSSQLYVPSDCTTTKILKALPDSIPNPKFIDTPWEPAEGTDLYASLNAGGLACSYGIQEAEIGVTVLWAPDDETLFQSRVSTWTESKQVKTDLPKIDEEQAFVLSEGDENSVERHIWAINLLISGVWIQVNATFLQTIDEAIPLIEAAIDSLQNDSEHAAANISGCYAATLGNDLLILKLDQKDRNLVFANISYLWSEKDQSNGQMVASYRNGILTGVYDFKSQGVSSMRELFFKGDKTGFKPGVGPIEIKEGYEQLKRPLQIKWDENVNYEPSNKCS